MNSIQNSKNITINKKCYELLRRIYSEQKICETDTFSSFLNQIIENYHSAIQEHIVFYESLIAMRPSDFHHCFYDIDKPFSSFNDFLHRVNVNLNTQNFELLKRLSISAELPTEVISDFYIEEICNNIHAITQEF